MERNITLHTFPVTDKKLRFRVRDTEIEVFGDLWLQNDESGIQNRSVCSVSFQLLVYWTSEDNKGKMI